MTAANTPQPDHRSQAQDAGSPAIAVFLSGSGRTLDNLAAIVNAAPHAATSPFPNLARANLCLVVASRACKGLDVAAKHGIPALTLRQNLTERDLLALQQSFNFDYIALAGYLRLLPVPASLEGRIVNIHPALLPAFGGPGMHGHHVHQAVLEAAQRGTIQQTGCTVHLCDNTYDTGPILLQKNCPVHPSDTPESIAARVFELECQAYPEALNQLLANTNTRNA